MIDAVRPDASASDGDARTPAESVSPRQPSIGLAGLLGHSVTNIAVVPTIAVSVGIIASVAGTAGWLSWLLAFPMFFAAAYCFGTLTRRYGSTGGLPVLLTKVTRPGIALAVAVLVLIFGVLEQPFSVVYFAGYLENVVERLSGSPSPVTFLTGALLAIFGAAYTVYRGVRLTVRLLLMIEIVAVVLVLGLMVAILVRHQGGPFDAHLFVFSNINGDYVLVAAAFAALTFLSFETSATLGREVVGGRATVTRSLPATLGIAVVLLVFTAYTMTLGFQGQPIRLRDSKNALADLAGLYGVHWLAYPVLFAVCFALWGMCVTLLNWSSRVVYTLARDGLAPRPLARLHPKRRTPRNAIVFVMLVNLVLCMVLPVAGGSNGVVWTATACTLLYAGAYVIAALVLLVDGVRRRRPGLCLAALVTAVGFGYAVYNKALSPMAPRDGEIVFCYAALVVVAVVAGLGVWLSVRPAAWVSRFGANVDVDTAVTGEMVSETVLS